MVVAELTGRNANVLYELGLAHALGKPFVIITNSMDDVPFDLKDLRCIVYDKDHPKWGDSLTKSVTRTMKSVLEEVSEHGPLFPEIDLDTEYPSVDEKTQEERKGNEKRDDVSRIAGVWKLTQKWGRSEDSNTTISLQQVGYSLSGYAISGPIVVDDGEDRWEVSQQVSGYIREKQFELIATSYQILRAGDETLSWSLDTWRGTMESKDFIRGDLVSESGDEGTFWGEKTEDILEE